MCRLKEPKNPFELRFGEVLQLLKESSEPNVDRLWIINIMMELFQKYDELLESKKKLKSLKKAKQEEMNTESSNADESRSAETDSSDLRSDEEYGSASDGLENDPSFSNQKINQRSQEKKTKKKKPKSKRSKKSNLLEPEVNIVEGENAVSLGEAASSQSENENANSSSERKDSDDQKKERKKQINRASHKGIKHKMTEARGLEVEAFYKRHRQKGKKYIVNHFVKLWGVSDRTIYGVIRRLDSGRSARHAKRSGRPRQDIPPEDVEEIVRLARENMNMSIRELSRRFNRHTAIIRRILDAAKIKRLTAKEKRMMKCALKGENYTPYDPHYNPDEARKKRQRDKILELKKKGVIPFEPGDLMPDGRLKTGPKFKKGIPPAYRNVSMLAQNLASESHSHDASNLSLDEETPRNQVTTTPLSNCPGQPSIEHQQHQQQHHHQQQSQIGHHPSHGHQNQQQQQSHQPLHQAHSHSHSTGATHAPQMTNRSDTSTSSGARRSEAHQSHSSAASSSMSQRPNLQAQMHPNVTNISQAHLVSHMQQVYQHQQQQNQHQHQPSSSSSSSTSNANAMSSWQPSDLSSFWPSGFHQIAGAAAAAAGSSTSHIDPNLANMANTLQYMHSSNVAAAAANMRGMRRHY